MTIIRITLHKKAYTGWNGQVVPARVQVQEFADREAAANWFIHDSYFEESYTEKALWEVIEK